MEPTDKIMGIRESGKLYLEGFNHIHSMQQRNNRPITRVTLELITEEYTDTKEIETGKEASEKDLKELDITGRMGDATETESREHYGLKNIVATEVETAEVVVGIEYSLKHTYVLGDGCELEGTFPVGIAHANPEAAARAASTGIKELLTLTPNNFPEQIYNQVALRAEYIRNSVPVNITIREKGVIDQRVDDALLEALKDRRFTQEIVELVPKPN